MSIFARVQLTVAQLRCWFGVPISYDANDHNSLALCLWREARDQGREGMRAVAHVIRNRVFAQYLHLNDPFHHAIYAKNQFTSMSVTTDPQYHLHPEPNDSAWIVAQEIARTLPTDLTDISGGAIYYANLTTMDRGGWFERNIVDQPRRHPKTATIGAHTFFA